MSFSMKPAKSVRPGLLTMQQAWQPARWSMWTAAQPKFLRTPRFWFKVLQALSKHGVGRLKCVLMCFRFKPRSVSFFAGHLKV